MPRARDPDAPRRGRLPAGAPHERPRSLGPSGRAAPGLVALAGSLLPLLRRLVAGSEGPWSGILLPASNGAVSPEVGSRPLFLSEGPFGGCGSGAGNCRAARSAGRGGRRVGAVGRLVREGGRPDGPAGRRRPRRRGRSGHDLLDVRARLPTSGPRGVLRGSAVLAGGELAGPGTAAARAPALRTERRAVGQGEDGRAGRRQ